MDWMETPFSTKTAKPPLLGFWIASVDVGDEFIQTPKTRMHKNIVACFPWFSLVGVGLG
jgi:hypothetical protein